MKYCDNVCHGLQNWCYCFYRWCHNVFNIRLTDKLVHESYELTIYFFGSRSVQWSRLYQRHTSKGKCPIKIIVVLTFSNFSSKYFCLAYSLLLTPLYTWKSPLPAPALEPVKIFKVFKYNHHHFIMFLIGFGDA